MEKCVFHKYKYASDDTTRGKEKRDTWTKRERKPMSQGQERTADNQTHSLSPLLSFK